MPSNPKTYWIRREVNNQIVLAPLVGGIFFVIGLLGIIQVISGHPSLFTGSDLPPVVPAAGFAVLGGGALVTGLYEIAITYLYPSEIRVFRNGTIEVGNSVGTKVITADHIQSIDVNARAWSLAGMDTAEIRIRHTNGTVRSHYFTSAYKLAEDLRELNPSIVISPSLDVMIRNHQQQARRVELS